MWYLGPPLSTAGSRLCDDISMFLTEKNKGTLPQSISALKRGAVWRGGQEAFAINGKALINFEEFLWEKTPRAQFTNYSPAQRTTKSHLISQDNEEPRESEGEPDRVRKRETNEMNHLSVEEDLGPWWPPGGRTCMRAQTLLLTRQSPSHDRQKYAGSVMRWPKDALLTTIPVGFISCARWVHGVRE